jgi:hypothetical protein
LMRVNLASAAESLSYPAAPAPSRGVVRRRREDDGRRRPALA